MAASLLSLSDYYASLSSRLLQLQQQRQAPAIEALFLLHRGLGSEDEEATAEEREEVLLFYHPDRHPRPRRLALLRVAEGLIDFTHQCGGGGGVEVVNLQRKSYVFLRWRPSSSPPPSTTANDEPHIWCVAVMDTCGGTTTSNSAGGEAADAALSTSTSSSSNQNTTPAADSAATGVDPHTIRSLLQQALDGFELFFGASDAGIGAFWDPRGECVAAARELGALRVQLRKGRGDGALEGFKVAEAVAASPVTALRGRLAAFLRPLLLQGQELERPHLFDFGGGGMHYLPPFPQQQPSLLPSLHAAHSSFLTRLGSSTALASSMGLRPLDATFIWDGHIVWRGQGLSTRELALLYQCLKARDHAALLSAMQLAASAAAAAAASASAGDGGDGEKEPPTTSIPLAAAIDGHALPYRRPSSPIPPTSNSSSNSNVGLIGRIQSFAVANQSGGSNAAAAAGGGGGGGEETAPPSPSSTTPTNVIWLRGGFFDASSPLTLVPPVPAPAPPSGNKGAGDQQPPPPAAPLPLYPLPTSQCGKQQQQQQQQQRQLLIYLAGSLAVLLVLVGERKEEGGEETDADVMRAVGVEVERHLLPALQQPQCLGAGSLFDRFGGKGGGGELMLGAALPSKLGRLHYRDTLTDSVSTSFPAQVLPELQHWPPCSHAHLKHLKAAARLSPTPMLPSLLDEMAACLAQEEGDGGFRELAIRTRQQGWLLARRSNDREAIAVLGPKVTSILEAQDAFNALLAAALKGRQLS